MTWRIEKGLIKGLYENLINIQYEKEEKNYAVWAHQRDKIIRKLHTETFSVHQVREASFPGVSLASLPV